MVQIAYVLDRMAMRHDVAVPVGFVLGEIVDFSGAGAIDARQFGEPSLRICLSPLGCAEEGIARPTPGPKELDRYVQATFSPHSRSIHTSVHQAGELVPRALTCCLVRCGRISCFSGQESRKVVNYTRIRGRPPFAPFARAAAALAGDVELPAWRASALAIQLRVPNTPATRAGT